jgi:hypothetical protein
MHFKNGGSTANGAYVQKEIISMAVVASRPRVNFDQMAAPVPEIMDITGII